jgi:hypothetical protein
MRGVGLIVALLVLAAMLSGVMSAVAAEGDGAARVFRPSSHPYGMTYREWAADWFEWVAETPSPTNPFLHPDNCGPFEGHAAWFLSGSLGGPAAASCTVPTGKGLLISPAGDFCSAATDSVTTTSDLQACARAKASPAFHVRLRVDGRLVRHIRRFFLVSRRIALRLPADNIFGLRKQTTPAVVAGVFVMIRPLPVGRHRVFAYAEFPGGFVASIRYHITVKAQ